VDGQREQEGDEEFRGGRQREEVVDARDDERVLRASDGGTGLAGERRAGDDEDDAAQHGHQDERDGDGERAHCSPEALATGEAVEQPSATFRVYRRDGAADLDPVGEQAVTVGQHRRGDVTAGAEEHPVEGTHSITRLDRSEKRVVVATGRDDGRAARRTDERVGEHGYTDTDGPRPEPFAVLDSPDA
jgi:hypothetical protein